MNERDTLPSVDTIVDHPYGDGYMMSGFAMPGSQKLNPLNASSSDVTDEVLAKRIMWLWWTFAAVKLAFTGIGLIDTFYICRNWSQGGAQWYDKAGCVVGAVSTAVLIGATGVNYGIKYEVIRQEAHPWLTNINQAWNGKRSVTVESYIGNLTKLTEAFANITGMPTATLIRDDMSIALNDQSGYPIHIVLTPEERLFHVSGMTSNSSQWSFRMIDPTVYNTSVVKRSEDFNMENFSNGGIEVSVDYESPEHSQLSSQYDWHQMTDEVSCYLGDMSGNTYQYQIYDNNHKETLSAGVLRAFSDEPFDEFTLAPSYVSWPVQEKSECRVD